MPFKHVGVRLRNAYKREERLSTQEWFEQRIVISNPQVSPITGPFRIRFSPHLKYLMYLWDIPKNREFYAKWASQSAKSFFLVGISAKRLDTEPANVLYMQPIKDDIPKIVNLKIDPLLKCVPTLWRKFEDYKFDESIRAKREIKRLAGGNLIITGSGVKDRKSLTVPMLVFDEAAEFEAGTISEAKERTKTFDKFFPKIFGASTIVHPKDEICQAHDGCQAKLEWRYICPSCSEDFYPTRERFKFISRHEFSALAECSIDEIVETDYVREACKTVHVECPHCQHKIDSSEKDRMVLNEQMKWVFITGSEEATTYGISMNSLGSYFVTFDTLVTELIKAEDDPVKLDKVYRGWFNEFYERKVDSLEENDLLLLGNSLDKWVVPADTLRVYMGVDTQKDHFWWSIRAYGYGKVSHTIASGRAETFDDLEKIWEIGQSLTSELGEVFQVDKLGIDRRGYNQDGVKRTEEVDAWVRAMVRKWRNGDEPRVYATEGEPKLIGDAPFKLRSIKDETDNRMKIDIKVMKLSNLYLKTAIRTAMANTIEMRKSEDESEWEGIPRYFVNQTTIDADAKGTTSISYTRQISAEVYDYDIVKGKKVEEKSFINPKQTDNHLFDCAVTCEGFAQKDMIHMERRHNVDELRKALEGLTLN